MDIYKYMHLEVLNPSVQNKPNVLTVIVFIIGYSLVPRPSYSAALGVFHHQHAERVWKLLHGSRVQMECNQAQSHVVKDHKECHLQHIHAKLALQSV